MRLKSLCNKALLKICGAKTLQQLNDLKSVRTHLAGRSGSVESFSLCLQSYAVGLGEDMLHQRNTSQESSDVLQQTCVAP